MPVPTPNHRERGATLVLFTFLLATFILPGIGFAIDASVAFVVRAKIAAAADAAALAGARALSIGPTSDVQAANATAIAIDAFHANFPLGSMNVSNVPDPSITIQQKANGRNVVVSNTVPAPTYFLRLLGFQNLSVGVYSEAFRRNVNLMLVLDRSGSMILSGACEPMKASAENFVSRFSNGNDELGLMTFMGSANVDFAPNTNFQSGMISTIQSINCGGGTGTAHALSLAHQQFTNGSFPPGGPNGPLNIIVLYTDGEPDAITGTFTTNQNQRCSPNTHMLYGFLANAGPQYNYPQGVYDASSKPLSITYDPTLSNSDTPGCYFSQYGPGAMPWDLDSIPAIDAFGNPTQTGYMYMPNPTQLWDPSNIHAASFNTADYRGLQIRQQGIIIYSIGEGSLITSEATTFLQRLANVPQSTSYDATQPVGYYVYAPNASQLASAFNTIALQILRLTQ